MSDVHQRRVLQSLKERQKTIRELSSDLELNYYTVRNAIQELLRLNYVSEAGVRNRSVLYSIADDEGYADSPIPFLVDNINQRKIKALGLPYMIPTAHKSKATKAAIRLAFHAAGIFMLAPFAKKGEPVDASLSIIREQMQSDLFYLKNTVSLYEQILDEPRFWNPKSLGAMTNDDQYNFEELDNLNNYTPEGEAVGND